MLTFGVLKILSRMLRGRCGHIIARRNRSRTWRVDWRFQGWVRVTASYHGSGKVLEGTQTRQVACTMVSCQTSVHPQSDPLTVWFIPALRVEWAKSRARELRWSEEVLLLRRKCAECPLISSTRHHGGLNAVMPKAVKHRLLLWRDYMHMQKVKPNCCETLP